MRRARSGIGQLVAGFCAGLIALPWTALMHQLAYESDLVIERRSAQIDSLVPSDRRQ